MASNLGSNRRLDPAEAFDVSEAFKRGALRVRSKELRRDAFALGRGEVRPDEPVVFIRDEGRTARDLIGTTYATVRLVSQRFIDVLAENGFTGWETFPVAVALDDGESLVGYHGLAVTGRCGAIEDRLSSSVELPPPVPGGRPAAGLRGLCFPPDTWDGSDVFTPRDRASIFITNEVMQALQAAKLTGLEFRRLSEIERPKLGNA
jgi:hypothetical protein